MNFSEADNTGGLLVRAYERDRIRIADTDYRNSLILSPERVIADWSAPDVAHMGSGDLDPVLALAPEVVVLGTGTVQQFPPHGVLADLMIRGIGLEVMDTGAACRTYNILMSEGRRVVAALIML